MVTRNHCHRRGGRKEETTMKSTNSSDRGAGYLIPPLPQSKRLSEKDGKARSPFGSSPKHKSRLGFGTNNAVRVQEEPQSFSYPKRHGSSKTEIEKNRNVLCISDGREVLAQLPYTKHNINSRNYKGKWKTNRSAIRDASQNQPPLISLPTASIQSTISVAKNTLVATSAWPSESRPQEALATTAANSLTPRVLRYRETAESLFCLTSESSEEHRQICSDIVDGHLVDDAGAWCHVLVLAGDQQQQHRQSPGHKSRDRDLLRLHRRATSRFPLEKNRNDQSSVFRIWLSYAKAVSSIGSAEDCRIIFQQMHDYGVGSKCASYYLALADFENRQNTQRAKTTLQLGMSENAQPTEALLTALSEIGSFSSSDKNNGFALSRTGGGGTVTESCSSRCQDIEQEATRSMSFESGVRLTRKLSPQKLGGDLPKKLVSKRVRTEKGAAEFTVSAANQQAVRKGEAGKRDDQIFSENSMSVGADEILLALSKASETESVCVTGTSSGKEDEISLQQKASESSLRFSVPHTDANKTTSNVSFPFQTIKQLERGLPGKTKSSIDAADRETSHPTNFSSLCAHGKGPENNQRQGNQSLKKQSKSSLLTSAGDGGASAMKKTPFLSSKTPRLARVGLSGKAQRVGIENSVAIDSCSDDSDESSTEQTSPLKAMTSGIKSGAKLKKMDIDYMWAWDPSGPTNSTKNMNSRNGRKTETKTPSVEHKVTTDLPPPPNTSAFAASAASDTRQSSCQSPQFASATRKGVQLTGSEQSKMSELSSISSHGSRQRLLGHCDRNILLSPKTANRSGGSNPEFLALVSENNIIRVNDVPYVKLGVVGKGGSSKVYRALTKECTVVAIKKVKLKGMDRKAIDGYANEIALLKSLRSNQAIIQMYDSEVDVPRKAIFVVMEAGEIDLNGVLQQQHQQAKLSETQSKFDGPKSLNINFIRLTWQQMLSAVHCIHEARIIHGDLKPANFLFVRGALKLIDFGIAKAIQSEDTTNIYRESQVGTVNYMSPEAILADKPGSQKWKCGRVC